MSEVFVAYATEENLKKLKHRSENPIPHSNVTIGVSAMRYETHDRMYCEKQPKPVRILIKIVEDSPLEQAWDSLSAEESLALVQYGGGPNVKLIEKAVLAMRDMCNRLESAARKLEGKI